ncbi:MAG: ChbG/HpnK family deacetylase [Phycisphaerae bacterium]|jgi:hopanoid biosynthesis associated protein HpnK
MKKRLIINADDFGKSPRVNEAVERAHTQGVLTSTTIMTNMDYFEDAVAIARKLPRLGVGVHLNLFAGRPVSREPYVKCLTDSDGNFRYSPGTLALLTTFRNDIRKAIKTEMSAQIQRLIDSGLYPTHLDSHKHLHFFPAVHPIVCSLARRFKISAIRYCRESAELSNVPWPLSMPDAKRAAKLMRAMAVFNRLYDEEFFKTQATFGLTHVGRIDTNYIKALTLYTSTETAELMTHPAVENNAADAGKPLKMNHRTEFEALCDERTKKYIRDADIELINYSQL